MVYWRSGNVACGFTSVPGQEPALDRMSYARNDPVRRRTITILSDVAEARSRLEEEQRKGSSYEEIIKKELEPFKYRDVVPLLHQTIISALPNEKNNPAQKNLYEAFANGDVEGVLKVPRKERKQIFVTGMSAYFANDLSAAQFGATDFQTRSTMGGGRRGDGS